jgi:very-short-patch-repair endonuclease
MRLHPVARGVYAVGRPQLSQEGFWMAAVLCCGEGAVLSHRSAGELLGLIRRDRADRAVSHDRADREVRHDRGGARIGPIDVSVFGDSRLRRPRIRVHRRSRIPVGDLTAHDGIPVTGAVLTLVDLATVLGAATLERAVNEADRLDLVDPEGLRRALARHRGRRGVAILRALLDRRTFRMTDSELERRFLPIVDSLGLRRPQSRVRLNGFRVDFHWPDLGLVVECDGLRYHRTPAQQARDHLRDQAHTAAGLVPLRFTHEQIRYEPHHVRGTLEAVVRRLERARGSRGQPRERAA